MYNPYPQYSQYPQMMGGQQVFPGAVYGARPTAKFTQPVTPELSKMLLQQNSDLDVRITNIDKIRSWCTHKEHGTGHPALVENADGSVTCRICGETFRLVDLSNEEEIKKAVINISDIMNTVKSAYADIPEEFEKSYMPILALIAKLPDLAKRAVQNFGMYEYYTGNLQYAPQGGTVNYWQAANGLANGFNVFPQGGMYQYPVYQQAPVQPQPPIGGWAMPPQGAPAPAAQPAQAPVAAPAIDPYGMVYPGQMFTPQAQQIPFNPLMATPGTRAAPAPAPAATAAAPAPAPEVQQTKQMSV